MHEPQSPTEQTAPELAGTAPAPLDGYEHCEPLEEHDGWLEQDEELPPRPRRRLLTPAPLALLAVLLTACGFIGGVLVEKGQGGEGSSGGSGSSAAASFASRLRGLASGASGASATGAAGGGFARPTSGTVSYVSRHTLYVTGSESNTVKVDTSASTSVTKTVKSSVQAIHPGETVTITGATTANGSVSAESIRVGNAGGGLGALFGGARGAGRGSGSSSSTGEQALFGNG